ncbi:hypothetical protein ACFFX0_17070 [Citricoccus parietis]|uniref:Uncharacterized protein n=1 Tax=Citricoccus parietis TaxID=592307 RepID=A0ABV5G1K7_9MICC
MSPSPARHSRRPAPRSTPRRPRRPAARRCGPRRRSPSRGCPCRRAPHRPAARGSCPAGPRAPGCRRRSGRCGPRSGRGRGPGWCPAAHRWRVRGPRRPPGRHDRRRRPGWRHRGSGLGRGRPAPCPGRLTSAHVR